jgi:DNA-binding NarL/FixJ family response regulator
MFAWAGVVALAAYGSLAAEFPAGPLVSEAKTRVVPMDINLPGMDGVECARRLKAAMPDVEFIVLRVYTLRIMGQP